MHSIGQHSFLAVTKIIGITAPAIYTGITFAYSAIVVPTIAPHAPPKLLAKQWLCAHRFGPVFAPPLIIGGIVSNAVLAYFARSPQERFFYILSALGIGSIIPYTALYMEPGINGAGMWKAENLLKDEGVAVEDGQRVMRCTATLETKKWADGQEMKDIVQRWGEISGWRYIITGFATVASGVATNWP